MPSITRRDFLKMTAALAGGAAMLAARPLRKMLAQSADRPNIILVLLDAMSATNLSLHGYTRPTTPYLQRFAECSTVYHNHYAASNFTTAGTASMLTGMYPWKHRAVNFRGLVNRSLESFNMYSLLGRDYHRLGYSQNSWVNLLLGQFADDVDAYLPFGAYADQQTMPIPEEWFPADYPTAYMAFEDYLGVNEFNQDPGSISLGLFNLFASYRNRNTRAPKYPNGLPSNFYTYFRIENVLAGMTGSLTELSAANDPFFAYFHLLPPHMPYIPRRDFLGMYLKDGIIPTIKPAHPLAETNRSDRSLVRIRMTYDEYITNLDYELGVFIKGLEDAGLLENSYLIFTSDHGEIFERAEHGHGTPLMYEPVTRIPLIIHAPGQTSRVNVTGLTSNVDLLPTMLSLTGRPIPSELEGRVLPGFGGESDPERSVFSVMAKESSAFLPLSKAVISMNKGVHKLIYYRGYGEGFDDKVELYDLSADPEEMTDLSADAPAILKPLKEELLDTFADADRPYQRK